MVGARLCVYLTVYCFVSSPMVPSVQPQVMAGAAGEKAGLEVLGLSLRRGSTVANEVQPRHGYC